ncbi:Hpt domain-containing protein [Actinoplanes sp. DH11]|uniref:Hpt domain-containing protein n=1 Tax=Actinoplanes sp. DH11 TaxID=2857011 RepID=UPI001E4D6FC8|nr:Hpt domain-containing protein [Actinoplanes sp. DH11]
MDAAQAAHDARTAQVRARLADITQGEPEPHERALLVRLLRSFTAKTPAAADEVIRLLGEAADGTAGQATDGTTVGAADATANQAAAELRERAHALKGSAANVGATGLAAVCADVESQARTGVRPDPVTTAQRIRAEVTGTLRAVTEVADDYDR